MSQAAATILDEADAGLGSTQQALDASDLLEIRNPSSGLCLGSPGAPGPARMASCHGQAGSQQWTLDQATGELRNPSSGLCLDSWGGPGDVRMHDCHGQGGNQYWSHDREGGVLENPATGLCLDSWGGGGAARMHDCHGEGGNQAWVLEVETEVDDQVDTVADNLRAIEDNAAEIDVNREAIERLETDASLEGDVTVAGDLSVGGTIDIGLVRRTCQSTHHCQCPRGTTLISGGADCSGNRPLERSRPHSNGWWASCWKRGSEPPWTVSVICAAVR